MGESRLKLNNIDSGDGNASSSAVVVQITKWFGGIVSLTLVLGVVFWAYQLGKRDANDVPVIQAMGGVARERPEDPQGAQAEHQGLDVNQVLASDETAAIGAQTQLAPPPQRATPEDQPISDQPDAEVIVLPVIVLPQPEASTGDTPAAETNQTIVLSGDPDMTRPVRRVEQTGLSPSADLLSDAIADAIAEANSIPEPVQVVSSNGNTETVPVGTQMIQLGVFDDEQSAIRNWDFLKTNQPDLLNGLDRYIERREAGGRVFYRLRAIGFVDGIAASDLCAVLMGRDVQCIPVAAR